MKIGSMNHPQKNVYEEIERIALMGFDFIDLTYEWPSSQEFDAKKIYEKLLTHNLSVVGHTSPSIPAVYPLESVRKAAISELERMADFFAEIGADRMNVHPFYYAGGMTSTELIEANVETLSKIADYCNRLGISLMLENFLTPFDNAKIFGKLTSLIPSLKIHLDIAHLNIGDQFEKKLNGFLKLSPDIVHYHIHDNHGLRDEHLPLGCGNIDWPEVARKIKATGYDDTFTLEIFCPDRDYLLFSKNRWQNLWRKC